MIVFLAIRRLFRRHRWFVAVVLLTTAIVIVVVIEWAKRSAASDLIGWAY